MFNFEVLVKGSNFVNSHILSWVLTSPFGLKWQRSPETLWDTPRAGTYPGSSHSPLPSTQSKPWTTSNLSNNLSSFKLKYSIHYSHHSTFTSRLVLSWFHLSSASIPPPLHDLQCGKALGCVSFLSTPPLGDSILSWAPNVNPIL